VWRSNVWPGFALPLIAAALIVDTLASPGPQHPMYRTIDALPGAARLGSIEQSFTERIRDGLPRRLILSAILPRQLFNAHCSKRNSVLVRERLP
jgi:hypothetical protein